MIVVVALAVWRISSMLVDEEGPYDVFVRLRRRIGVRYDDYSQPYGTNVVAKLFTCVWCLSFWVGLFAAIFFIISDKYTYYVALPFAFSAVAVVLDEVTQALVRVSKSK